MKLYAPIAMSPKPMRVRTNNKYIGMHGKACGQGERQTLGTSLFMHIISTFVSWFVLWMSSTEATMNGGSSAEATDYFLKCRDILANLFDHFIYMRGT